VLHFWTATRYSFRLPFPAAVLFLDDGIHDLLPCAYCVVGIAKQQVFAGHRRVKAGFFVGTVSLKQDSHGF
jgi:hypothetical protein